MAKIHRKKYKCLGSERKCKSFIGDDQTKTNRTIVVPVPSVGSEDILDWVQPISGGYKSGKLVIHTIGGYKYLFQSQVDNNEVKPGLPDVPEWKMIGLHLGEDSDTAYRGDRGKVAYDHSQEQGNPHGTTFDDLKNTLPYDTIDRYRFDGYKKVLNTHSSEGGMVQLGNGDLLFIYRQGIDGHHTSNESAIYASRSTDEGDTWGDPYLVHDTPGRDDRNIAVGEDGNGGVVIVWRVLDADLNISQGAFSIHSDDGITWSSPSFFANPDQGDLVFQRLLLRSDGVYAVSKDNSGFYLNKTTDKGVTWVRLSQIVDLTQHSLPLVEPFVIDLPDGKSIILARVDSSAVEMVSTVQFSSEDGLTYTYDGETNINFGVSLIPTASPRAASNPVFATVMSEHLIVFASYRGAVKSSVNNVTGNTLNIFIQKWEDVVGNPTGYIQNHKISRPIPNTWNFYGYPVGAVIGNKIIGMITDRRPPSLTAANANFEACEIFSFNYSYIDNNSDYLSLGSKFGGSVISNTFNGGFDYVVNHPIRYAEDYWPRNYRSINPDVMRVDGRVGVNNNGKVGFAQDLLSTSENSSGVSTPSRIGSNIPDSIVSQEVYGKTLSGSDVQGNISLNPSNRYFGISPSGNILNPEIKIYEDKLVSPQFCLSDLNEAPDSPSSLGSKGEIRFTQDFIYLCIQDNTWVRTPLTTWTPPPPPMALNFIDFLTTNAIDTPFTLGSIETFIIEAFNFLEKMDLFYITMGNSDFGTVNIVDPDKYRATEHNLIWSVNGCEGNGVNGWMNTNFNPALLAEGQKYQRNDASKGAIQFSDPAPNLGVSSLVWGLESSIIGDSFLSEEDSQGARINQGITTTNPPVDCSGTGLKCAVRYSSSEISIINKETVNNRSVSSNSLTSANHTLHRRLSNYGNKGVSAFFMGAAVSFQEIQVLRQAFNNLLSANGLDEFA